MLQSAGDELALGLERMLGRPVERLAKADGRPAVWVGIEGTMLRGPMVNAEPLTGDGFRLSRDSDGYVVVGGATPRGALYGAFALLRRVALGEVPETFVDTERPSAPLRWVNEWNNLDGSIERGYAGRSIFFADGHVVPDLSRAKAYARLLASVGINGCTINNVNADTRLLTDAYLPELVRVAEAFRPWGVKLSISVDFSSPQTLGGLDTFDPLDPRVAAFWKQRVDAIYAATLRRGGRSRACGSRAGEPLTLEGMPDGDEQAVVDYVEFTKR